MGRSVNKVTLIGTLGRDPEMRYMPNGNPVANISLATDESYNDKQTGQKVEQTEWHRITAYGKLAEIVQQYLKKGAKAYFEGKLRTREWEKDGIKRYTTEIIANDMLMLDSRQGGSAPGDAYGMPHSGMGGQRPLGTTTQAHSRQPQAGGNNTTGIAAAGPTQMGDLSPGGTFQQPQSSNQFDDYDDDIPF